MLSSVSTLQTDIVGMVIGVDLPMAISYRRHLILEEVLPVAEKIGLLVEDITIE